MNLKMYTHLIFVDVLASETFILLVVKNIFIESLLYHALLAEGNITVRGPFTIPLLHSVKCFETMTDLVSDVAKK